jgi:hypothetical protein
VPGDETPVNARGVAQGVPVGPMLREYASFGLRLAITEWHSGTLGMAAYLRNHPSVELGTVFAIHSYLDFGLVDHPEAAADFLAAAGGPLPMPEPPYRYVYGFKEIHDRHPDLIGQPIEDERGPWLNASMQRTENGLLIWGLYVASGDQKGFIANGGQRYVWRGDRLEEVA